MDHPALSGPPRLPEHGGRRNLPVDFRDDDGLLYRGKLLNGTEDGILVTTQTGKHAGSTLLVPYEKVYFCEKSVRPELSEEMERQEGPIVVEVLVRLNFDQPMQWYPAILSFFDDVSDSFGLVSIVLPASTVKVVVPANRIRTRLTEWDEVTKDDLREFAEGSPTGSMELPAFQPFRSTAPSEAGKRKFASADGDNSRSAKRLKPDHEDSENAESGIQLLPAVILAEIFECLETPVRCRYRNVCSHWNAVLSMPQIQNQLRLNYTGYCNSDEEQKEGRLEEEYLNAVCASKCWAPTIIITGFSDHEESVCSTVGSLCRILKEFQQSPARTVILSNMHWSSSGGGKRMNDFAQVCQKVTFRNIVLFEKKGDEDKPDMKIRIVNGRLVGGQQLSERYWRNSINNCMPPLTDAELTLLLEQAAAHCQDENGEMSWEEITQALKEELAKFLEEDDCFVPSPVTLEMPDPSAKDLAKLELQKFPRLIQQYVLGAVRRSAVVNFTISW